MKIKGYRTIENIYSFLIERLRTIKINKEFTADRKKLQIIIQLLTNLRATLPYNLFDY